MKQIIALIDYKGRFGSKHYDFPYRSGMNIKKLTEQFNLYGYNIIFKYFTEIINNEDYNKEAFYIYTSSEDDRYYYKSFIEDVVLSLEVAGCIVIPGYKYLRANNNKVFMELLRNVIDDKKLHSIRSKVYGTLEELKMQMDSIIYPVVLKKSEGASGSGVFKAISSIELIKIIKEISKTKNLFIDIKDYLRKFKHKGYIKESKYREKYVIQNFIPNLKNDWKIYFFGKRIYVFYRPVFKHRDFRASGGGYDNYFYGEEASVPDGLFDFIKMIMQNFRVPHASLDIAYDGLNFHLLEIQFIYFGTAGIPYSSGYFFEKDNNWVYVKEKLSVEEVYVSSIIEFVTKNESSFCF